MQLPQSETELTDDQIKIVQVLDRILTPVRELDPPLIYDNTYSSNPLWWLLRDRG